MLVYQSFGEFKKQAYKVYTTAEHLSAYRDEYPTRRRQLNAVNKDVENMRDALHMIEAQLKTNVHASYLGDKYGFIDMLDMRDDLENLEAARDEIFSTACPAKAAKEAAAQAEKETPTAVTIELPEGLTAYDLRTLILLSAKEAHAQRMEAAREHIPYTANPEAWTANADKCNHLSHLFNGANEIGDQLMDLVWSTADVVKEHTKKSQYFNK